jgi:dihydroflavonol-4-reductase
MTTLITGATGFVGSALANKLLARSERVRVLVRATADRRNLESLAVEIAIGDLTDPASLAAAVKGCDTLFHVAADYRLWVPDPAAMFRSNVEGTRQLMIAAAEAGVRRIVYTSSVATLLPRPGGHPAGEEDAGSAADMVGAYKQSKHAAELIVREMIAREGLPAVIVHPSTPIGPRDIKPTPTGRMIVEAASGRMPAFVDTGLNLVHVDDVAKGHLLAEERGKIGERYILGGENLALAEILRRIAGIVGRKPPTLRLPIGIVWPVAAVAEILWRIAGTVDRKPPPLGVIWPIAAVAGMIGRITSREPMVTFDGLRMARKKMFFSSAKAERELGYSARPVDQALADAIDWFRQQGMLR